MWLLASVSRNQVSSSWPAEVRKTLFHEVDARARLRAGAGDGGHHKHRPVVVAEVAHSCQMHRGLFLLSCGQVHVMLLLLAFATRVRAVLGYLSCIFVATVTLDPRHVALAVAAVGAAPMVGMAPCLPRSFPLPPPPLEPDPCPCSFFFARASHCSSMNSNWEPVPSVVPIAHLSAVDRSRPISSSTNMLVYHVPKRSQGVGEVGDAHA